MENTGENEKERKVAHVDYGLQVLQFFRSDLLKTETGKSSGRIDPPVESVFLYVTNGHSIKLYRQ